MKRFGLLLLLLIVDVAVAQNGTPAGKTCIAFSSDSDSSGTNIFARDPLATAVTLSGDFEFYASDHYTCWTVHVLSIPVYREGEMQIGYAVSYTVTDPRSIQVGHGLLFGPDRDTFERAMRNAAADAIKNIRLVQSSPQPSSVAPEAKPKPKTKSSSESSPQKQSP